MKYKELIDKTHLSTKDLKSSTNSSCLTVTSPINNEKLSEVTITGLIDLRAIVQQAQENFQIWSELPAPKRGEIIREIGVELRIYKEELAQLITLEMGKIIEEARGEVQEAIDMADFCVGLSRQLYGLSMHSERAKHRMYEQWHPLGCIGVITAFNFPVAVWAWNALLAAVCGNTVIWKPSELTPLTAIYTNRLANRVLERHNLPCIFSMVIGGSEHGAQLCADKNLSLISATGSVKMGREVAKNVGSRLGRTLLELGGNNALIVLKDADLKLAKRAILFGAVGTAGQRCTTTRRLIVESAIYDELKDALISAYHQIKIGDPMLKETLMGPLISKNAVENYSNGIELALTQGGKLLTGGKKIENNLNGNYVEPTIIESNAEMEILNEEIFAPILHLIKVSSLDEALELNNSVPQGLSSALFSNDLRACEKFLSHLGSDCGIANINIGTSGAEIGGAFGGEKDTGGGRESGSDSWKNYMRRQTNTINWGATLPLAQGIDFDE